MGDIQERSREFLAAGFEVERPKEYDSGDSI
jgi:hypothetical protein